MGKKLYVGGIPYKTTEENLKDMFTKAGNVASASIIIDRATGRSKGFGFVEMASEEEAAKAVEILNNTEMEGRTIKVDMAREMSKPAGGFKKRF